MANYILNAFSIVNSIGGENARLRIFYLLKRHSGYLAWKTSAAAYQAKFYQNSFEEFYPTELDEWLVKSHRFFPRVSANNLKSLISDQTWESQVTSTCEAAVRGDYPFFSNWTGSLGWPPEFNCDPVSQASWPRANHWTQANCSISPSPDIKLGWEASRLSLVFIWFANTTIPKMTNGRNMFVNWSTVGSSKIPSTKPLPGAAVKKSV